MFSFSTFHVLSKKKNTFSNAKIDISILFYCILFHLHFFLLTSRQKLQEEEERDLIIYSIRNEIIDIALQKCYENYLQNQSIKFVAHCAHKALVKLLELEFYYHDQGRPYYFGHPDWMPDLPLEPSPSDSYCAKPVY